MKRTLSNTTIGAIIGLANTILYMLLFPLFLPMESFVTFFSFDGSFWWIVMMAFGFGIAILVPNIAVGAVIGMLVSLPCYYWSARVLVTLLAFLIACIYSTQNSHIEHRTVHFS